MVVVDRDNRSMMVVIDLLQVKMLVTLLRRPTPEQLLQTTLFMQRDGFAVSVDAVKAAASGFAEVAGFLTDQMVTQDKLQQEGGKAALIDIQVPDGRLKQ